MIDVQRILTGVRLGDDGIWYAQNRRQVSYPDGGNDDCLDVESVSFWFRHRNNCITSLIRANPPVGNGPIFDIGGGNGFVSFRLVGEGFEVVLVEPGISGAYNAKARGLQNVVCASFEDSEINPDSLVAVGLFDVLEHVDDDRAFLSKLGAALVQGGRLYLSVPAYSGLWSKDDERAGHLRRYSIRGLSDKLEECGFEVSHSTYIFRFLPPLIFLLRTLPFKLGLGGDEKSSAAVRRDHGAGSKVVGWCLDLLALRETMNIQQSRPMMYGGSCLVAATKV